MVIRPPPKTERSDMKAVNRDYKEDWIPPCDSDLPKEEQTVFEIGCLTSAQEDYLNDICGAQDLPIGTLNQLSIHMGLRGVRNFNATDGSAVTLDRDNRMRKLVGGIYPIQAKILDLIDDDTRILLGTRIRKMAKLSEAERKN